MLTEEQAREIERGRQEGLSGPVCARWVDMLLEDRRDLLAQLDFTGTSKSISLSW
jgi:hypothetical protein